MTPWHVHCATSYTASCPEMLLMGGSLLHPSCRVPVCSLSLTSPFLAQHIPSTCFGREGRDLASWCGWGWTPSALRLASWLLFGWGQAQDSSPTIPNPSRFHCSPWGWEVWLHMSPSAMTRALGCDTWAQMISASSLRFWTTAQMSRSRTGSMVKVTRPAERL